MKNAMKNIVSKIEWFSRPLLCAAALFAVLVQLPAHAQTRHGDEAMLTYNTPEFRYGGKTYKRISVDSNGYLIVGGGDPAQDNNCCLPAIGDKARPNNVLAPFWTDMDGTGAPGLTVARVTLGGHTWVVVQW